MNFAAEDPFSFCTKGDMGFDYTSNRVWTSISDPDRVGDKVAKVEIGLIIVQPMPLAKNAGEDRVGRIRPPTGDSSFEKIPRPIESRWFVAKQLRLMLSINLAIFAIQDNSTMIESYPSGLRHPPKVKAKPRGVPFLA